MVDRVGQQLGNYRLLRELGRGNFAEVYLAEHLYLERLAAIKVLHVQMDPETQERFLREARTIEHLHHPHIIQVLDFGLDEQTPYLVMQYTPGGTLREHHPKGTRLPVEQIVTYLKQIASALDYAHQQRVIHRDIKPHNLLLTAKGEVVLSDFGFAVVQRSLDALSLSNPGAGTPLYMAPEQIQMRPCAASDQYALGVMVYEWLAGEVPFSGNTLLEVLSHHLYQAPPSLCERLPDLPTAVEAVVFKALVKDPEQRFACVTDFASAFEDACEITQRLTMPGLAQPRVHAPMVPQSTPFVPSAPARVPEASSASTQPAPMTMQGAERGAVAVLVADRPIASKPVKPSLAQNNRQRFLRRVRAIWIEGMLDHSLQGAALIALGLQEQVDALANPWHLVLHHPDTAPRAFPVGTRITEVYDAANEELLILGAPGAGKTTLLLELARDLLDRAEQDAQQLMPVVFPVSSWAAKQQPLTEWMIEELTDKYQVPRQLARTWVETDQILPLLDGLDEVVTEKRTTCIETINTYHQEHPFLPLVVSSRSADYLQQAGRLKLTTAVTIQSLTQQQVDDYLSQGGESLWALRVASHQDAPLRELAESPLMLSILTLTYHDMPVEELLRGGIAPTRQQLFEHYVERMLTSRGPLKAGTPQQVVQWLTYLAARMRERNQTVFYLEHVQPDWLTDKQRRAYEWFGVFLPAITIGVLVSMLTGWFFLNDALSNLLVNMVLGGMLGGILCPIGSGETAYSPAKTRHQWRTILSISIGVGLIIGFSVRLAVSGTNLSNWLGNGLVYGMMFGLSSLLLQSLLSASSRRWKPTFRSGSLRWTMLKGIVQQLHLPRALLVALLIGLSEMLSEGLINGVIGWEHYGLSFAPVLGLSSWPSFALSFGLNSILISVILERSREAIHLTEHVSLPWRNLRNRLFASTHLRLTLILTGCITVFFTLSYGLTTELVLPILGPDIGVIYQTPQEGWLSYEVHELISGLGSGLGYGLGIGLLFWLLLGLYQSIAQEQIGDQDRRVLNQGIQQSLRNSLLFGLISGTLFGGMGIVAVGLSEWLGNWLSQLFTSQLLGLLPVSWWWGGVWQVDLGRLCFLFVVSSVLFWMITGGLAVWRHYLIRFLLRRTQIFPWKASRLLDDATARILLRRVGGGYIFVHRLLLEYFASLDTTAPPDATSVKK